MKMRKRYFLREILIVCCLSRFGVQCQLTEVYFDQPVKTIHEDVHEDTIIADVQLQGAGTNDVTCNLQDTDPKIGPFDVWRKPGDADFKVYYTAAGGIKLSYSSTPSYTLTVVCSDGGNPITTQLEVDVLPNKSPTIIHYPGVTVKRNASSTPPDVILYAISVADPENDAITYTMSTEPAVPYFNLDVNNGILKTAVDLRTATESVVSVKVNVSDGKNIVGPFTVRVELSDLNGRPYFTGLPTTMYVHEDALPGYTITTLTFGDDNDFTLEPKCTVDPSSESFKFDYETGSRHLRLTNQGTGTKLLDYESTRMYNISCVVSDGFLNSKGSFINLHVLNVNEAPEFNHDVYYCNLYESDAGVSVCDVSMTVRDPDGDFFTTDLLHGNNSQRFAFTSSKPNSRLTFNVNYDVDDGRMPKSVMLTVGAVDSLGLTGSAKIAVTVNDVNDNIPEFIGARLNFPVGQITPQGILGSINATDKDSGDNAKITYSLKGAEPATTTSYVHVTNHGEVRYTSPFPDTATGSYLLFVEARDHGNPAKSSTGTVVVTFTTTTTSTTTTTLSTTLSAEVTSFWDRSENVALFACLMTLLAVGVLIGACLLLKWCLTGTCCGGCVCDGICFRESHVRRVRPMELYEEYYPTDNSVASADYREDFWRKDDHFEDGRPWSTSLVKLQERQGQGGRGQPVLPRKYF